MADPIDGLRPDPPPRPAGPADVSVAGRTGAMARLRRAGEPALRRVLHVYWRVSRGLTLGVRGLVVDREGRVFLVKHSYLAGWYLPGGGVEVGESMQEALDRELREEGNLHLTATPVLHGIYLNARVSRRDHVALFVVRAFEQPSPMVPNREIVATGFFAPDALPPDTTRGTRARIVEVLSGGPTSDRW